jgi:hypothetical protein
MDTHNANNTISLKDKRLNLIRAAQDLGINTESFCGFLKRAIEAEENVINITHGLLDEHHQLKRDKSLVEAKLIHLIFEEF